MQGCFQVPFKGHVHALYQSASQTSGRHLRNEQQILRARIKDSTQSFHLFISGQGALQTCSQGRFFAPCKVVFKSFSKVMSTPFSRVRRKLQGDACETNNEF